MTESELIDAIDRLLPDGYRLEIKPDGNVRLIYDDEKLHDMSIIVWRDPREFLFGSETSITRLSFFNWLNRCNSRLKVPPTVYVMTIRNIIATRPELLGLAGCSSVEEIELKMTVMGLIDSSRKTLGRKEDD